jgi:hypothetical protein
MPFSQPFERVVIARSGEGAEGHESGIFAPLQAGEKRFFVPYGAAKNGNTGIFGNLKWSVQDKSDGTVFGTVLREENDGLMKIRIT